MTRAKRTKEAIRVTKRIIRSVPGASVKQAVELLKIIHGIGKKKP